MLTEITQQLPQVAQLCRQFQVQQLAVFGSAVSGAFVPTTSDLDFVVRFANTRAADYADRYLDFAEALEALFKRKVDLLTERSIRNPYFREEVERTQQVIYAEPAEKTPA